MPWNKPYHPSRNQRLDPDQYTCANRVYFITIRAYLHQSPFVSTNLNQLVLDILREEQRRRECHIFTYCLLPDHLHYLISPSRDGVSVLQFTDQYKGKATNGSWTVGWRGKLWQPRSFEHIVRSEEDLGAIAEYIRNNPVRKDLCETPGDWPWAGSMNPLPW